MMKSCPNWVCRVSLIAFLGSLLPLLVAHPVAADHPTGSTGEVVGQSEHGHTDLQPPLSAIDLSGQWSGRWCSQSTGHQGVLRAHFEPCGENRYKVTFTGRFLKLLPFRYSVILNVVSMEPGSVELSGSAFLGKMFGTFCYQATATDCEFAANYTSTKDSGKFKMRRVSR